MTKLNASSCRIMQKCSTCSLGPFHNNIYLWMPVTHTIGLMFVKSDWIDVVSEFKIFREFTCCQSLLSWHLSCVAFLLKFLEERLTIWTLCYTARVTQSHWSKSFIINCCNKMPSCLWWSHTKSHFCLTKIEWQLHYNFHRTISGE